VAVRRRAGAGRVGPAHPDRLLWWLARAAGNRPAAAATRGRRGKGQAVFTCAGARSDGPGAEHRPDRG